MTSHIDIENRTDAIVWECVDAVFSGRLTSREAAEKLELDYYRGRAVQLRGEELLDQLERWLADLSRETTCAA